jgi:3' terminal RNA ribose 2'-O-methyltransferase Hen1
MLLTISTTHEPATDLGYLVHKNPARAQSVDLSFGRAHVVYPEANAQRCTVALVLDVDPVGLVRGRRGPEGDGGLLAQYVNDRPYAASSFLSVAIAQAFGTAMAGRSKERPELAAKAIPLEARLTAVPCRGGEELLRRLFEPLGYAVESAPHLLDPTFPEWRESRYYTLTLTAEKRLAELLAHIYVLVPVLDGEKHYWVGDAEVEKLLRVGEGWLATHPERELIARRYLKHRHSLVRDAIARLVIEDEGAQEAASDEATGNAEEERLERPVSLNEQRLATVLGALRASGATSVVDLGCGEGRLLRELLGDRSFQRIVGMDVSYRALEIAASRFAAFTNVCSACWRWRASRWIRGSNLAAGRVISGAARPYTVMIPSSRRSPLRPSFVTRSARPVGTRVSHSRSRSAASSAAPSAPARCKRRSLQSRHSLVNGRRDLRALSLTASMSTPSALKLAPAALPGTKPRSSCASASRATSAATTSTPSRPAK